VDTTKSTNPTGVRMSEKPPEGQPKPSKMKDGFDEFFSERPDPEMHDTVIRGMDELKGLLETLSDGIAGSNDKMGGILDHLSEMSNEIARLKTDDTVMAELQDRNRALSESFHERELLHPIFLSLIGIADRCAQQVTELECAMETRKAASNEPGMAALRRIRDARMADAVEVHNVLAGFAVECFEVPGNSFDPEHQTCVQAVEADDERANGLIKERLLPGYRRNGTVVRPERVAVWVTTRSDVTNLKGADS